MKHLCLGLVMLVGALGAGCSKSNANVPAKQVAGSAAAPGSAPVVGAPALAGSAADPAAPDACDDACTNLAICHERFYEGESFRDGDGCVQNCAAMSVGERTKWVADVADAHRTNRCARLFEGAEGQDDAPTATLAAVEPTLGCFAWSTQLNAVACIVGDRGSLGTQIELAFVGGGPAAMPLVEAEYGGATQVEAAVASTVNGVLAKEGFTVLAGAATTLKPRTAKQVGGLSIKLTKIETDKGGNNIAPTYDNRVVATCGGRTVELFREEGEGASASATARALGAYVLVEVSVSTGREGEFGDSLQAILVETSSCKITKSSV